MSSAISTRKPEFATNQNGKTVSGALKQFLGDLREPSEVAIATAYFSVDGFNLLADELESAGRVRLLLGSEPQNPLRKVRSLTETPGPHGQEAADLERALKDYEQNLVQHRNLLGFTHEEDARAKRLISWAASENVDVRLLKTRFLHGKAYLVESYDHGVISGSSNFTAGGLARNLELNLGQYQGSVVKKVKEWFDMLWEEAEAFDLSDVYGQRYAPHSPYLIYLRMLYELYGAEVEAEAEEKDAGIRLTQFQEDGLWRAKKMLRRHNGVIIADGVGLGKTFIAGELIREAAMERRQHVLVVAPATLRDGPWRSFLLKKRLPVECISYQQLAQALSGRSGSGSGVLQFSLDRYAMVVIDEAHAYRNEQTHRSESLRRLLQGSPRKDVVMLTATPVNNSLWDLYTLLSYFIPNDAAFADTGITSLRAYFKHAMKQDPETLSPELLFDVLDQIVVRRTRHFVKKFYPNERIPINGEEVTITFPEPKVRGVDYAFDEVLPGFFSDVASALVHDPDEEESGADNGLTLSRYMPSRYRCDKEVKSHEMQVAGLLRSGLLKRFESSVYAFANTCGKMVESHDNFLQLLDQGFVATGDELKEWAATDTDDIEEFINDNDTLKSVSEYEVDILREDVESDRKILHAFEERARGISRAEDPKLQSLIQELIAIVKQAEEEGLSEDDKRQRRKVLIFSYYADTVEWIRDHLKSVVAAHNILDVYDGRIASTTGQQDNRKRVLFGFAPVSTEAPDTGEDLFDIVVATDVLAEGVNLQQVRHIINFDLPWNPMRLVQRHGRIDRIGSPHDRVYIRCIFPDAELESLLELEDRLQLKIAQAAASIGVESEVIPGSQVSDLTYTKTREEIERLREGDPELFETGGEAGNAYSGEEYRQELRQGLQNVDLADQVKSLPWGSGSGKQIEGATPGFVFCAQVADHEGAQFRFVRLEDGDSEAEKEDDKVIKDRLTCLAYAHAGPEDGRVLSEKMRLSAYDAWEEARSDIFETWQHSTDPTNLQPDLPKAMREAAAHLRDHHPPGVSQSDLESYLDTIEAPYNNRTVRQFRNIMRTEKETDATEAVEISRLLIDKVDELGLEPPVAAEPLPPITEADVHLICWMAITPVNTSASQ